MGTLSAMFQWGHNPTVMDTRQAYPEDRRQPILFQWGHNPTVMDTMVVLRTMKMDKRFQWGHNPTVMDTAYECLIS